MRPPARLFIALAVICSAAASAEAQYSDGFIKIGVLVLNDSSALYADISGPDSARRK
jgi:hypothetical protein